MADTLHTCVEIMDKEGLVVMDPHILNITGRHNYAPTPFSFTQGLSMLLQLSPAVEDMAFYIITCESCS